MLKLNIKIVPKSHKRLELLQTLVLVKDDLETFCQDASVVDQDGKLTMTMNFKTQEQMQDICKSAGYQILISAVGMLGMESKVSLKKAGQKAVRLPNLQVVCAVDQKNHLEGSIN